MNPETEMQMAQESFNDTVGACYVFLRKNGMKKEAVQAMLGDSLYEIMNEIEKHLEDES